MFYLCLAFSLVWICHGVYLFSVERQVRQMARRLDARAEVSERQG